MLPFNALYKISPEIELKILFYLKQHYKLNLDHPRTYNEKLQWIKLYDRNQLMPVCCDKFLVRKYVQDQGCSEILNTLIWEGFNPEEIPFDKLPEKYVIKVTHGSTFNIINNGSKNINKELIIKKCKKWLSTKFLPCYGEWFYGIKTPRVIIENFLVSSDEDKQLRDYKVFCFNGEAKLIKVDSDRSIGLKSDFYDKNWERINNAGMGYPRSGRNIDRPLCLDKLINYAEKLSQPFKHARVDFYIIGNNVIFGEITFTTGAGFDKFSSYEFDLEMGSWLDID